MKPGRRLIGLVGLGALYTLLVALAPLVLESSASGAGPSILPYLRQGQLLFFGALLCIALWDLRGRREIPSVKIERILPSSLALGEPTVIKVYPDFEAIKRYIRLALHSHTHRLGIKRRPRRGEGTDFHQLRSYRREDTLR